MNRRPADANETTTPASLEHRDFARAKSSLPVANHEAPITNHDPSRLMEPGAATVPSISAVVPVYNSEANLPDLVRRLQPMLAAASPRYELVFINDGSPDRSWEVIQRLCAEYPWVRGIELMRNYGQHNAILCGVRAARYDIIVTMDDDLQHPPEELPKLLAELNRGLDVVYGAPEKQQHGLLRDLASA